MPAKVIGALRYVQGSTSLALAATLLSGISITAQAQDAPAQQAPAQGAPAPAGNASQLEPITVISKYKAPAKKKAKAQQKSASAAAPPPAVTAAPPEPGTGGTPATGATQMSSAIGPVDGYVATNSATGTKTNTPILETPQVVNVITADQIQDQGALSVSQALRYTPGVGVELNGASSRYSELRIRGFIPVQYLDGLAVPLNNYFGTPLIYTYGLERIEVLKGPGSFLYGQNSPGGLLNTVSKRPRADHTNEVQLQVGSFGLVRNNFDLGDSTSDGRVLYRMVGSWQDAETEVDYTRDDNLYLAPSITWNPQPGTSLTLLATYGKDRGSYPHQYLPTNGVLLPNPNGRILRSRFIGEPGFDKFERDQYSVGYALEHEIDDTWSFRQNLRYFGVETLFRATREEGLLPDMETALRSAHVQSADAYTFSVDNQVEGKFETGAFKHDVLFGFDYMRMNGKYIWDMAYPSSPINVYDPVYGSPIGTFAPRQYDDSMLQQAGIYVQDQIKLDSWILTLGGRVDWSENETDDLVWGAPTASREDTEFTGRAALQYVFGNGIAPYVSYGTTFQPTIGVVTLSGEPFVPTTGEQFEVGVKYQPPGTNTLVQLAAFDITQENAVTYDPSFNATQTGEYRVRGFDIEVRSELTRNISVIAGYAFLDSEVLESSNPLEIGRRKDLVSEHAASLWAQYEFHEGVLAGLAINGGVRYVGDQYSEVSSVDPLLVPDYTLFDAGFSYDLGKLDRTFEGAELQLNVNNIFDKYHAAGYCDRTYCSLGAGRTVLTTLSYKW